MRVPEKIIILYIKATCPSVRPGPETHTFSFQVSRNEGSVYLGTKGKKCNFLLLSLAAKE